MPPKEYNFNEQPDGCPACGSDNAIMMDDTRPSLGEPEQCVEFACGDCPFSWTETWKFSHWSENVG